MKHGVHVLSPALWSTHWAS